MEDRMKKIVLCLFLFTFITLYSSTSRPYYSNRYFQLNENLLVFLTEKGPSVSLIVINNKFKQINKKDEIIIDHFDYDIKYVEDKENQLIHIQYTSNHLYCIKTLNDQGKVVSYRETPFTNTIIFFDDFSYFTIKQTRIKNDKWVNLPQNDRQRSMQKYMINDLTHYNANGDSCWSIKVTTDHIDKSSRSSFNWNEGALFKSNQHYYIKYKYNFQEKLLKINENGSLENEYAIEAIALSLDEFVTAINLIPLTKIFGDNYLVYDSLNKVERVNIFYKDHYRVYFIHQSDQDLSNKPQIFLGSNFPHPVISTYYKATYNDHPDSLPSVKIEEIPAYTGIKEDFIKHPDQYTFISNYIINKDDRFWIIDDFMSDHGKSPILFSKKLILPYIFRNEFYILRLDNDKQYQYSKNRIYYNYMYN